MKRTDKKYIRSPLAGGFLTGKLSLGADITGTRFEDGNMMGAHYRPMYDKTAMHAAVKDLQYVFSHTCVRLLILRLIGELGERDNRD